MATIKQVKETMNIFCDLVYKDTVKIFIRRGEHLNYTMWLLKNFFLNKENVVYATFELEQYKKETIIENIQYTLDSEDLQRIVNTIHETKEKIITNFSILTYFECVHIESNIKHRLRHNGKLINIIIMDLFEQGGGYDPTTFLRDVEDGVKEGKTIYKNVRVCIAQDTKRDHDWIMINEKEIKAIYDQVVQKTGKDVNMNDFGEDITLY